MKISRQSLWKALWIGIVFTAWLSSYSACASSRMEFIDTGQRLGTFAMGECAALADIDSDGDSDVIVGNIADRTLVYLNDDGYGHFTVKEQIQCTDCMMTTQTIGVALGQLDNDDTVDVFLANNGEDFVWLNDGAGAFQAYGLNNADDSRDVALGDVDRDGDLDAVVINGSGAQDRIWYNDGYGNFTSSMALSEDSAGYAVALGDLNHDGWLDIFVANRGFEWVWLSDGNGGYNSTQLDDQEGKSISADVVLGDIDLDGDLDAVVVNGAKQQDIIWLNDGHGSFSVAQRFGSSNGTLDDGEGVVLSDFNQDGFLDIFIASGSAQPNLLWMNNGEWQAGTGQFIDSGKRLGGHNTTGVALADLDNDGDQDVFVTDTDFGGLVYQNQGRLIFLLKPGKQLPTEPALQTLLTDLKVTPIPLFDISRGNSALKSALGMNRAYYIEPSTSLDLEVVRQRFLDPPLDEVIEKCIYDHLLTLDQYIPSDPGFQTQQANLQRINMPEAWGKPREHHPTVIAVIDSSIYTKCPHPDLESQLLKPPLDFTGTDPDGRDYDHGMHVAAIAAAAHNSEGMAGICPECKILPLHVVVSSDQGNVARFDAIFRAIEYAVDEQYENPAVESVIINISLSAPLVSLCIDADEFQQSLEIFHKWVQYAYLSGVPVVASAGNLNWDIPHYPACYDEVISVGATDTIMPDEEVRWVDAEQLFGSNYGSPLTLVAPGVNIYSAIQGWKPGVILCTENSQGFYGSKTGTSMAAPHVSGVMGLLLAHNPHYTIEELRSIVTEMAERNFTDYPGHPQYYGAGRLEAAKTLDCATGKHVEITPLSYHFGDVPIGATAAAAITISNPCSQELAIGNVQLQPPFTPYSGVEQFSVNPDCSGQHLAPGQTCDIEVRFSPQANDPILNESGRWGALAIPISFFCCEYEPDPQIQSPVIQITLSGAAVMPPTPTPTCTPTIKPTPTFTPTPIPTLAPTTTPTLTPTSTPSTTLTPTPTPTFSPISTATPTPQPVATAASTPRPGSVLPPAATLLPSVTPTTTPTSTPTPTMTPTTGVTPLPMPTLTPSPTVTPDATITPVETLTPEPTPIATRMPDATSTPGPAPTPTPTPETSATFTVTPTPTPTRRPSSSVRSTPTPSPTPSPTATPTIIPVQPRPTPQAQPSALPEAQSATSTPGSVLEPTHQATPATTTTPAPGMESETIPTSSPLAAPTMASVSTSGGDALNVLKEGLFLPSRPDLSMFPTFYPTSVSLAEDIPIVGETNAEPENATDATTAPAEPFVSNPEEESARAEDASETRPETAEDASVNADDLVELGDRYMQEGRYAEAEMLYQQAADLYQTQDNVRGEGEALKKSGAAALKQAHYAEAIDYYTTALNILQTVDPHIQEILTLIEQGDLASEDGLNEDAIEAYQTALAMIHETGLLIEKETYIQQRLDDLTRIDQSGEKSSNDANVTNAMDVRDDTQEHVEAVPLLVRDKEGEESFQQADTALRFGLDDLARQQLQEMLEDAQRTEERRLEAETLNRLAVVDLRHGEFLESQRALTQAQAIQEENGDLSGKAETLSNQGTLSYLLGEYEDAAAAYQAALSLLETTGTPKEQAILHNNLALASYQQGQAYARGGELDQAQDAYQQAIEALNDAHSLALESRDKAVEGSVHNNRGLVYTARGHLAQQQGDEQAAHDSYSRALSAYQDSATLLFEYGGMAGKGATLHNLGELHVRLGQDELALEAFQQALQIEQAIGNIYDAARTLSNIGYLYERQAAYQQAVDWYLQAIDAQESLRSAAKIEEFKISLAEQALSVYQRTFLLLLKLSREEEAFTISERARARAFLDQLGNIRLDLHVGGDVRLVEQEQTLRSELARLYMQLRAESLKFFREDNSTLIDSLKRQIASKQKTYRELLIDLKASHPEYASLISVTPLSLPAIQNLLPEDVCLIEYVVTPQKIVGMVIARQTFEIVALPMNERDLAEMIARVRQKDLAHEETLAGLSQLYTWLIAPLDQYVKNSQMLGIIPDDVLHYLPFAALVNSPDGGDQPEYFGDRHLLFALPGASVWQFILQKQHEFDGTILAVANKGFEPGPLKFAEQEAEKIAELYPQTAMLLGKDATEQTVTDIAGAYAWLHFSAHASLNPVSPFFSGLVLADGELEVHEIYGIDLPKADLVTLSACNTQLSSHLGAYNQGREIVALNRAFLYAGSPSVVATLWSVNDEATYHLMVSFYTFLQQGLSKAQALQQAQREIRQVFPHPYYWAGFVLSGHPGKAVKMAAPTPPDEYIENNKIISSSSSEKAQQAISESQVRSDPIVSPDTRGKTEPPRTAAGITLWKVITALVLSGIVLFFLWRQTFGKKI